VPLSLAIHVLAAMAIGDKLATMATARPVSEATIVIEAVLVSGRGPPAPVARREPAQAATANRADDPPPAAVTPQTPATAGVSAGSEEITPPLFAAAYLNNPKPEYPPAARRLRQEGTVVLRVWVNERGAPEQVLLQGSSGVRTLDEAAVRAVSRWSFMPAHRGLTAVASWADVPISFSLAESK
jgi:protein TonB